MTETKIVLEEDDIKAARFQVGRTISLAWASLSPEQRLERVFEGLIQCLEPGKSIPCVMEARNIMKRILAT